MNYDIKLDGFKLVINNYTQFQLNMLYFTIFGTLACFYPFFAIYLQHRSLSYTEIGVIFAVNSLISIVCQPIWGFAADKYLNKKYTLIIILLFSALLVFVFDFSKSFYPILIITVLFTVFQSPIVSVNDAYCYEIIEHNKKIHYGKIRLMGSVGFALISLIVGAIIKKASISYSYLTYLILALAAIVILIKIKYRGLSSSRKISGKDITNIIKNKKFIIISISALIANAAWGANNNYLALLIQKTGGDVSKVGLLWFIIALSEIPAFYFGNKLLKKYGVINVYLISLALYSLRFLGDSLSSSTTTVLAVQLLQGVTFPLFLMTTLQYVSSIVPMETRTSAITLFNSITIGAGGFIGNFGGGIVLQNSSIFLLYKLMSLLCLISLGAGSLLKLKSIIKHT